MNSTAQHVHVVGPERHRLYPAKATVGEELDQLCTTTHPLINRIGQVSHLLGCQISLIPFHVGCVSRLLGQTPPRFHMDSIIPLYSLKGKGWLTPPQWRSRRQIELA